MQDRNRRRVQSIVWVCCLLLLGCRKPVSSEVALDQNDPQLVQRKPLKQSSDGMPNSESALAGKPEQELVVADRHEEGGVSTRQGPAAAATLFQRIPASDTGIDLVFRFPKESSLALLSDQSSGSGVCIGDVDGDDLPDIYVTNYNQGNRLYKNLGDLRFQDTTTRAGVGGDGRWCAGPNMVDIDNDGDLDLYVCAYGQPNLLYINQGDGTFREDAKSWGIDFLWR